MGSLHSPAKAALAAGLAALLLAVGALSASPWLHGLLHRDASAPHHLCLACAFAKGQVTPAAAVTQLPLPMPEIGGHPVIPGDIFLSDPCFLLPQPRGPPCA